MARIRSIKPEFFTSEAIAALPLSARLTFIGLWTYVDDNGVGPDNDRLIVASIWPLEEDPLETLRRTREDLQRLHDALLITRYRDSSKRYLHITSWDEHQSVSHPRKPRYPKPETCGNSGLPEALWQSSGGLGRPSVLSREQGAGSREQGKKPDGGASATRRGTRIADDFTPTAAMTSWAQERCPHVNIRIETEKFVNYWRAKSGQSACKLDWPATWRNWMLTEEQRAPRTNGTGNHRPSTTDQRIAEGQALKQRLAARNREIS